MNSMVGSAVNDQWKKPRLFSRILRRFSRVDDAPKRDRWKKGFKLLKKSNRVEEEGENSLKEGKISFRTDTSKLQTFCVMHSKHVWNSCTVKAGP